MKHRSVTLALLCAFASATVSQTSQGPVAAAGGAPGKNAGARGHVKPLPAFVKKREKERLNAADLVAKGQATPNADGIVELRNGRFVNYRLEGTEYLTAVLIDFTDQQHGQIPEPNRAVDNSSYWSADVTPGHYYDMLFTPGGGSYGLPSMHDYYLEQSSGRFGWTGQVSNWVQVDAPQSEYGANNRRSGAGGDDLNGPVFRVVQATLQAVAASGNYGGLDLGAADQVDRYDCDGDGDFAEPDGYVDHFGIVHAGQGEEAGGAQPTRSGVTAGMPTSTMTKVLAVANSGATNCPARICGSATTRFSLKTAALASSRTSSVTISDCPISTTRLALRTTALVSGPL